MIVADQIEISAETEAVPKVDLHLHAEAGPRLHRHLARNRGEDSVNWVEWADEIMREVPPGMPRLEHLSRTLISPEEDAVPSNFLARVVDVLDESARAGAIYVEVRFGRETVARPDFMTLFRAAEEIVSANHPGFAAEALATLIPQRDPDRTGHLVKSCLEMANQGLAGVDIIPDPYEIEAEWTQTYQWAEQLTGAGLRITVHAGEFTTANVSAALKVPGIMRIGHGIQVASEPELIELVRASGVALECCSSSNVILGAVASFDQHPLPAIAQAELPFTINTDNPVQFSTNIAREYEIAYRMGLTPPDLQKATETAIEFAFTRRERKDELKRQANTLRQ